MPSGVIYILRDRNAEAFLLVPHHHEMPLRVLDSNLKRSMYDLRLGISSIEWFDDDDELFWSRSFALRFVGLRKQVEGLLQKYLRTFCEHRL